jgi:phosphatidylglycerophosphatase A
LGINFIRSSVIFITSLAYVGYIPIFPGTLGTFIALPICFYLNKLNLFPYIFILIAILVLGIYLCHLGERIYPYKDPPQIILDELLGYLVALFLIPFNLKNVIFSFILFRFLDIKKPLYLKNIQNLPGGIGIALDDIVAGVITNIIMQGYKLL